MKYEIRTTGDLNPIVARTHDEPDAEEVGAALALAGYNCVVYYGGKLIHEFFAS